MAKIVQNLGEALTAAAAGMNASAFERYLRSIGKGARSSEVRSLYAEVKAILRKAPDEPFRDITQVPLPSEMDPWGTKGSSQVRQNIAVIIRDRTTGNIRTEWFPVYSETGVTREQAMSAALGTFTSQNAAYNTETVGVIHGGAYQYIPRGF